MPSKTELQTMLRSANVPFKASDKKEVLMEKICAHEELKRQLKTCGVGDLYSSMTSSKIVHKGSIYDKIIFKKEPTKFIGLFKKRMMMYICL